MASTETVNLDALIPRADMLSMKAAPSGGGIPVSNLRITEHYYKLLRKPNFQRETDDWSIDNVVSLIKSFRDAHLIPTVILWAGEGNIFVIDGAHRLSVFIAWINDDYGDKHISQGYFHNSIPKRQKDIARKCRERINAEGLTYSALTALAELHIRTTQQARWSTNIARNVETQWVTGDASVALQSFLDINRRAVLIDKTERHMIEHMNTPAVIAARAIVNNARGHAYWGSFNEANISTIVSKSKKAYDAIFEPEDAEAHRSSELQPAGAAHTANGLRLALDLVTLINEPKTNEKKPRKKRRKNDEPEEPKEEMLADSDGTLTARYVERTYGVVKYIAGNEAASLGLHPSVYFWAQTGNHRPTLFLAVVSMVQEMVERNELIKFTMHRAAFEEFLVGKSSIAKQILGKYGGWLKSLSAAKKMLRIVLDGTADGKSADEIEAILFQETAKSGQESDLASTGSSNKWRETKSAIRIKASLENAPRCPICKARLVLSQASDDHILRVADGGANHRENAQLTHRYCNHGFKEHFVSKGQPLPEIVIPA